MNTTTWRPRQSIRTIAIAVIQRSSKLLLMEVRGDDGKIKGWRPLGGEIEFGETAAEAVARELKEETGLTAKVVKQIGVVENIYEHESNIGHEVVFCF